MSLFDRNGGNLLKKKLSRNKKSASSQIRIYTAEDMKNATNNYSDRKVMERCNPGTFYRGNLGDRPVAVMKIPTVPRAKVEGFVDQLIFLSHPHTNLVKIMGCCLETNSPLLVYELHGDGNRTLVDCLRDDDDSLLCVKAAAGAARGLAYLHSKLLFHGNICSGNILVNDCFDAKLFCAVASGLIDEGNCVYRDSNEVVMTSKSDVYSFGVVLVELLTRGTALASDRWGHDRNLATWFVSLIEEDRLSEVVDDVVMWSEVAVMAARCLSVRPEERLYYQQTATAIQTTYTYKQNQRILKTWHEGSPCPLRIAATKTEANKTCKTEETQKNHQLSKKVPHPQKPISIVLNQQLENVK